jgi:putative endopeptidase
LDSKYRPQDDLFRFVNGKWLATAQIAPDLSSAGSFIDLRDASEVAVRDIITSLEGSEAGTEAKKIEDLYASFMDTERIASLGLTPLNKYLQEIEVIHTIPQLLEYFGRAIRRGIGGPLDMDVESDPGDPTRYILFVSQSGIGLPDEEYYRLEQHAPVLAKYRDHIDRQMALAELGMGASSTVVALETEIAAQHWDKVKTRDMVAMYNPTTLEDFCKDFDWTPLFTAAGIADPGTFVDCQPSFFTGLAGLLKQDRLEDWKLWCKWELVSAFAALLPDPMVQEQFDFYGTTLSGTPQLKERWKRGVSFVEGTMGEAIGKLYVAKHFPPQNKERMVALVANLIEAYRISIEGLDWMSPDTKKEALKKLSKFTPKIGYPDRWFDYSGLEVDRRDLVGNSVKASEFFFDDDIHKLQEPIRKWEWLMTPQTVNAYYNPLQNEIVFPAAILQPPFFDMEATDAENYGSIGAVIGHEIGHGFDDQGSTVDGDGLLRNWWTDADRQAFEERTSALVGQYDALVPEQLGPDGQHVNGSLTLGENIGDLGGLGIALLAWHLASKDAPEAEKDEEAHKLFFYSWALSWQTKRRDEALKTQITVDPHSPDEFRCNQVVKNIDAFHATFHTQPGDGEWLAPADRVKIW